MSHQRRVVPGPTSLPPLRYLIVHPAAVPPVRGLLARAMLFTVALTTSFVVATSGSAGYDISASADYSIKGGSTTVVSTGLMLGFPKGTHGQLVTRSSLAARGVNVTGGLLDNDYCGTINPPEIFFFPPALYTQSVLIAHAAA